MTTAEAQREWLRRAQDVVMMWMTKEKPYFEENGVHILQLAKIVGAIKKAACVLDFQFADGFQLSDVPAIFSVQPIIEEAVRKEFSELTEEEQDALLVAGMLMAYRVADTWPDGEQNRLNIPLLFGRNEEGFERMFIHYTANGVLQYARAKGWL